MTNRFGSRRGIFCAVFFIVAGLLLLLQNFGYISGVWHFIWPTLLIVWGVSILLRPQTSHWCCGYSERKDDNRPVQFY